MTKENLTLTEAIQNFNSRHSARAADKLHSLFPVSDYWIPVSKEYATMPKGGNVPFLIIQHPEVGNYLPVFSAESEVAKAELPKDSMTAKVDFKTLTDILKKCGPGIKAIIFDPAENPLIFQKDKFLKYIADLSDAETKTASPVRETVPKGKVVQSENGMVKLDKNAQRLLKKEAKRDSRIEKAWLVREVFENGAVVWNLVIDSKDDRDSLLKRYASHLNGHVLKKESIRPCFASDCTLSLEEFEPFYTLA